MRILQRIHVLDQVQAGFPYYRTLTVSYIITSCSASAVCDYSCVAPLHEDWSCSVLKPLQTHLHFHVKPVKDLLVRQLRRL